MDGWGISTRIRDNLPITSAQLQLLKRTLRLPATRKLRYADASKTEDLIVFEVQATDDAKARVSAEATKRNGLLLISIASDNVPEHEVILLEDVMEAIVTEWM